jgi:hypothetical protein
VSGGGGAWRCCCCLCCVREQALEAREQAAKVGRRERRGEPVGGARERGRRREAVRGDVGERVGRLFWGFCGLDCSRGVEIEGRASE